MIYAGCVGQHVLIETVQQRLEVVAGLWCRLDDVWIDLCAWSAAPGSFTIECSDSLHHAIDHGITKLPHGLRIELERIREFRHLNSCCSGSVR